MPSNAFLFAILAIFLLVIAVWCALWIIYSKAGKPGWAALIPIYNVFVLLEIVGRPWWWVLLLIIPLVNIIIGLVLAIDLAKSFGRSTVFGMFGLWLFAIIGYLILGFGKSNYLGPIASNKVPPPPSGQPINSPASEPLPNSNI